MRRFEIQLAFRHLRSGGWQTVLTVGAVAVAVTLVVFISSLIYGGQERMAVQLTAAIPQVTVKPPDPPPPSLGEVWAERPRDLFVAGEVEDRALVRRYIEEWPRAVEQLRAFPHVEHVSPIVNGQGFVRSGARSFGVSIFGAVPEDYEAITGLTGHLVAGRYLDITVEEVVLGWRIADDLGVALGDRVRITSTEGVNQSFVVAGLYDTGRDMFDRGQVFVNLRAAQSLFGSANNVSSILVSLDDLYKANEVADRIHAALGYETDSWMREFAEFDSMLAAQRGISILITVFSLLASSLGITSVLIVAVLQKSKQIGILKAMGARRRQIMTIFTLEGLFIALLGACVGALLGIALLYAVSPFHLPPRPSGRPPDPIFPFQLMPVVIFGAMAAAIAATLLASLLPARRAASLDPVKVIR